jgi:biopolymer transport protein ExbD
VLTLRADAGLEARVLAQVLARLSRMGRTQVALAVRAP